MNPSPRARGLLPAAIVVWLLLLAFGFYRFEVRENAPGPNDAAIAWPGSSALAAPIDRPVLIMFAHPRCPCMGSSLEELARLLAQRPNVYDARVLLVRPEGVRPGWEETAVADDARAIPGVTVILDDRGREAALFGAETAGHVLVYGTDGKLLYSGGITGARGEAGDNRGRASLAALAKGEPHDDRCPVFGCSLRSKVSPREKTP